MNTTSSAISVAKIPVSTLVVELPGVSGMVRLIVTGFIIDATGSFRVALLAVAVVLVIRRVEPLAWSAPEA